MRDDKILFFWLCCLTFIAIQKLINAACETDTFCAMLQSFKALICRHNAVLLMFYSSASLKCFIDRFDLILFK